MKIGIMSLYYKTYNYGAQLQSYALQKAVHSLGFDSELIRYNWQNADIENFYQTRFNNIDKFREFSFSIPHSTKLYDPKNIHQSNADYDIFICGSDQIWGVTQSMPRYILPHMCLSFTDEEKVKFSYGASFGGAKITTDRIPIFKYWGSKLDTISMREQSAVQYIEDITGKSAVSVLDPTFLLERTEWESLINSDTDDEDYIFVYNIGGNRELEKAATTLSEKIGCTVKTIAYSGEEEAGPIEFLKLIKNAKYVLTTSFHGTCFSIIFEKQFYTFPVDNVQSDFSKNVRIKDLLKKIDEQSRFIVFADEVDFDTSIDYKKVNAHIATEKVKSLEFLRNSIEYKKELPKRVIPLKKCCSCGACVSVCPQKCISLEKNDLGSFYPIINENKCIECGLCREHCGIRSNENINNDKKICFAAVNNDIEIRKQSSSGGTFSALAGYIIEQNGVVFGAKYDDNFNVVHASTETIEELSKLRVSKYVESDLGETFKQTKDFLEQGRIVLYCGCGCHINTLKSFLVKDYENLFTVDLLCGGVPARKIWDLYKTEHQKRFGELKKINHRTKQLGYLNTDGRATISSITASGVTTTDPAEDYYMSSRYNFFRKDCYYCDIKRDNHCADLSIGDCIGSFFEEFDDGYGLNVVIIRNDKGENLFEGVKNNITSTPVSYKDICFSNSMIEQSFVPFAWSDYEIALLNSNNMLEVFYENKRCKDIWSLDEIKRKFNNEVKRNSIYLKILKYQMYNCVLDDEPFINGKVVIYGAGKIGRVLVDCCRNEIVACFLESTDRLKKVDGLSVYGIGSNEIEKIMSDSNTTIIITPVWDFEDIYQNIHNKFPNANIVSVEKVVEKLWE
ncbi:MAG: polysaccharide pyruvyl transferase family protein [Oscillospiraceae bacterium]|jgi:coenzyme F420-reducing hydrogenase beta subunit|nr:polysaccharide pyruvyl transferase family protein [Oscillospiraceae bacterium]